MNVDDLTPTLTIVILAVNGVRAHELSAVGYMRIEAGDIRASDRNIVMVSDRAAISMNGILWAWGSNHRGLLGDGTTISRHSPVRIGAATNWVSVSAGCSHTVGVRTDGTLWAWGENWDGQLGDGTTISRHSPVRIGAATNWVSMSAGSSNHTVGVKTDGTLWAWGENWHGQLGDGTTTNRQSPVQIAIP